MAEIQTSGYASGILAERIRREQEFTMKIRHEHPEYELYLLLSGERYYFIGSQSYHVRTGDLVFIAPNRIHKTATVADPEHERFLLSLSPAFLTELETRFDLHDFTRLFEDGSPVLTLSAAELAVVQGELCGILEELRGQKKEYLTMVSLRCAQLFLELSRLREGRETLPVPLPAPGKHQKVGEIAQYLSTHAPEVESLDALCARFYLSKFYLCRIFKEVTGVTVNAYLNRCKIRRAQTLLRTTSDSVTAIAASVGYDSITHFETMFKQFSGITPLRYRKQQEKDTKQ